MLQIKILLTSTLLLAATFSHANDSVFDRCKNIINDEYYQYEFFYGQSAINYGLSFIKKPKESQTEREERIQKELTPLFDEYFKSLAHLSDSDIQKQALEVLSTLQSQSKIQTYLSWVRKGAAVQCRNHFLTYCSTRPSGIDYKVWVQDINTWLIDLRVSADSEACSIQDQLMQIAAHIVPDQSVLPEHENVLQIQRLLASRLSNDALIKAYTAFRDPRTFCGKVAKSEYFDIVKNALKKEKIAIRLLNKILE